MTTMREVRTKPTLDDAIAIWKSVAKAAKSCGYTVALYGSTLADGQGNDVDLIATPTGWCDYGLLREAFEDVVGKLGMESYVNSLWVAWEAETGPAWENAAGISVDVHVYKRRFVP